MELKPDLSVCMIVKDEEHNLPALLEGLRAFPHELVVVDTGSRDATVRIARDAGARLSRIAWTGNFATARNASFDMALGRWILWLDADDRFPESSVPRLRELVASPPDRAWALLVKNTLDGGQTGTVFSQIRLVPNHPRIRFTGAVHEQLYPSLHALGITFQSDDRAVIFHTGYSTSEAMKRKQERNRTILMRVIGEGDVGAIQHYHLGTAECELGDPVAGEVAFRQAVKLVRAGDADQHLMTILPGCVASCRILQQDLSGALAAFEELLPRDAEGRWDPLDWHPSQLNMVAKSIEGIHGSGASLEYWEKLWDPQEGPALLPINHLQQCAQSMERVAAHWKSQDRESLAMGCLLLARDVSMGRDVRRRDLPLLYLQHGLVDRAAELAAFYLRRDDRDPQDWVVLARAMQMKGDEAAAAVFARQADDRRTPNGQLTG